MDGRIIMEKLMACVESTTIITNVGAVLNRDIIQARSLTYDTKEQGRTWNRLRCKGKWCKELAIAPSAPSVARLSPRGAEKEERTLVPWRRKRHDGIN